MGPSGNDTEGFVDGGDRLTKFPSEALPFQLVNNYGPSEGCVVATSGAVVPSSAERNALPEIGKPLPHVKCLVLDETGEEVGINEPGLLWIAGPGLAREYLNRPEETEEKFHMIEFQGDQIKAYCTGDIVSKDEAGRYHYYGRNDAQVNVNGVRIELGEIESILQEHSAVSQAVVLPVDIDSKTLLMASVVPSGLSYDVDEWVEFLKTRLPKAMIPVQTMTYDALPLTTNGKVDRKTLEKQQREAFLQKQKADMERPVVWNDELQHMVSIFAETLGLSCSAHSDLFSMGGDSIHAAQIASQISKHLQVICRPSDVLQNRTPARLAELLKSLPADRKEEADHVDQDDHEDWFSVTSMQRGIWYLCKTNPENAFYHVGASFVIQGALDEKAFIQAWTETLGAHAALHLTFREHPERQAIQQKVRRIEEADVAQRLVRSRVEGTEAALSLIKRLFRQPFDLEHDRLFRGALIQTDQQQILFLLTAHHMVCDGLSLQKILKELAMNYEEILHGTSPNLPERKGRERPDHLRHFVDQQWNAVNNRELARYWKEQAQSFSMAEFPVSEQGDGDPYHGEILECRSEAGLGEKLEAFCKESKVSRFTVMLAAWVATLSTFCRQKELTVGIPFHGRSHHDYIERSGMFVNLVPVTFSLDRRKPFREWVKEVEQKVQQSLDHGDFSIVDVARNMDRKGGFDVVNTTFSEKVALSLPLSSAKVTYLELDTGGARFPLNGFFHIQNDRIAGHVEYSSSLFTPSVIHDFVDAYFAALTNMVHDPLQPWAVAYPRQSIIQPDEGVTRTWLDEAVPLHHFVERAADQYAGYTAVKDTINTWTFQELNQRAEWIAFKLQQFGVAKGDYVPLVMHRTAEMVAAVLGVLKAGAVYVPIDPESPYERNRQLLRRLHPDVVLQTVKANVPDGEWHTGVVEEWMQENDPTLCCQPVDIQINDPAYLMFTSGSTGEPKGVLCPHAGASLRVLWQVKQGHLLPGDRVLGKTPYTFDVSVWEMFFSLAAGATLVLAPEGMHRDPEGLVRLIREEKITLCHFVPSVLYPVLDELETNGKVADAIPLKFVHTSGEALPTHMAHRLKQCLPKVTLLNLYGPTETGIEVTCCEVNNRVNIGSPLPYVEVRVSDEEGNPVPQGFPGELWLGGPSLAIGYIHHQEETDRVFVEDSQRRYYQTGDLVRLEQDGSIDFIGRIDAQVKIKGVRIEPGEIEACVTEISGVQEAAVVIGNRQNGERSLVCFYVLKQGESVSPRRIKEHIVEHLPQAYIPALLLEVDALPLTGSGKRDRKWLSHKASEHLNQNTSGTYQSPQTEMEQAIARVWQEVLDQKRIGMDEHFFERGGDSIKSLQIITRLKKIGVELKPQDFIRYPTIAEQAWIAEGREDGENEIAVAVEERVEAPVTELPLTPLQSVMLMETLKDPESNAYWQVLSYELPESIPLETISAAWNKTVQAHPALRTRFVWQSVSEPKQVIQHEEIQIREVDWEDLCQRWDTVEDWYDHVIRKLKVKRLRIPQQVFVIHHWQGKETSLFVWVHHHILLDGWSLAQCLNDFFQALEDPKAKLDEHPTIEGYVEWMTSREYTDECRNFWRNTLQGVQAAESLHIEKSPSSVTHPDFRVIDRKLGGKAAASLKRFCRTHRLTPSSVLLTVWGLLIQRYQSNREILVGTTFANRPHQVSEAQRMSGMLINTLPVKVDVSQRINLVNLCKQIMEHLSDVSEHTGISYSDLLKLAELPGATELFQSTVIFQNFAGNLEGTSFPARLVDSIGTSSDPLSLTIDVQETDILTRMGWDQHRYREADVMALVQSLQEWVESLEEIGSKDIHDFSITAKERHMLEQCLKRPSPSNDDRWSVEWLLHSGQESKRAITDGVREYSYAEAACAIHRLAVFLRNEGVQKGDTVALVGKKGIEVALAMMAVWKRGAAWCTIDADDPASRKQRTLHILKPKVILDLNRVGELGQNPELDADLPTVFFQPDDIAYFIATSGSTGVPKIVALPAGGLCQVTESWKQYYEFHCPQNVLQLGSWTSDVYLGDLIKAWSTGGTLIVCPEEKRIDMDYLNHLTDRYDVTLIESTPVFVREWVDHARQSGFHPRTLQTLIVGSDTFRIEEKQTLCEKLWSGVRLFNGYGLSECMIESVVYPCHPKEETAKSGLCPIGRPLPGTHLRVVDETGRDVPPGVIGELHIGGPQVAQGYVSEEGGVSKRFYQWKGMRFFQTGDLVRMNHDGDLEFFGRRDQLVKIRGFRVELGEIENALLSLPAVHESFVAPVHSKRGTQLVAFVGQCEKSSEEKMMDRLRKRLPDYALPQKLVLLEALPRNANGKIDRPPLIRQAEQWVQEMQQSRSVVGIEKATDTTQAVQQIWEHLLNKSVHIERSFFDQGGHSLLVLELFQQLKRALPYDSFVIGDLFRYPTIQGFVSEIESRRMQRKESSSVPSKNDASNRDRLELLHRLKQGDLSVDEALELMNKR